MSDAMLDTIFAVLKDRGPDRVVVNVHGDGGSPKWAQEEHGVDWDVVFIRNDGWTLGAPKHLEDVARRMWHDLWIAEWHKGEDAPRSYEKTGHGEPMWRAYTSISRARDAVDVSIQPGDGTHYQFCVIPQNEGWHIVSTWGPKCVLEITPPQLATFLSECGELVRAGYDEYRALAGENTYANTAIFDLADTPSVNPWTPLAAYVALARVTLKRGEEAARG